MDSREFVDEHRQYLPMISKFFAYRVENKDIEDLASEVFSIAWLKRDKAPEDYKAAWLYRIAANVLANHKRKSSFRSTLPLFENDLLAPSAEQLAIENVSIRQAWNKLSTKDRSVLTLLGLEGLDITEISKILRISKNATTIRIFRAKQNLERLLKESQG